MGLDQKLDCIRPQLPASTKSPRDFAVAHHQDTIHPGGRRRELKDLELKDLGTESFPGGTRHELRQRVGVEGGLRRGTERRDNPVSTPKPRGRYGKGRKDGMLSGPI
jgi:hypothetical protein